MASMVRPSERVNRAIISLEQNTDWMIVREWIDQCFQYLSESNTLDRVSDEKGHRINQGRALFAWEMGDFIRKARENLAKQIKKEE